MTKRAIYFRLSKELNDWVKTQIESIRFGSMTHTVEEGIIFLQERVDGEKQ